jgi:hypothetical protein
VDVARQAAAIGSAARAVDRFVAARLVLALILGDLGRDVHPAGGEHLLDPRLQRHQSPQQAWVLGGVDGEQLQDGPRHLS